MRPALLFVVLCVVASFAPLAFGQANTLVAKIFGTGIDPNVTGQVTFTRLNATYTRVHVYITGITVNPDSDHGIHVHLFGDTTHANGTKAGPHLIFTDPDEPCKLGNCNLLAGHGCPETNGTNRHAGDMGNWRASGGVIDMSKELDLLPTVGPINIVGHAVILHELADSCAAASYGHAGTRLGQGVIGVAWGNRQAVDATHWAAAKANPGGRFVCLLRGTAGNDISGQFLVEPPDDVRIRIVGWVKGLNGTNGQQWGVHVHEFGDIVATNNGTSVGGHYNPGGAVHALPPTAQRHTGDLGNIGSTVANGAVWYDQQLPGSIINHHYGPNSLLGRGLIIHSMVDDGCTQPTGNAGNRLAWCVWGLSSQSGGSPDIASTVATVVAASGRGGSTPPAVPAFTFVSCDAALPPDGERDGSASGLFVSMAMIIAALVAALLL